MQKWYDLPDTDQDTELQSPPLWALSLSRSKPLNQSLSSVYTHQVIQLGAWKSLNLQTSGVFWYCFNQSFNLWKTFLLAGCGAERKRDWNSTKETREKAQDIKFAKTPKHHQSTPGNITKPSTRPINKFVLWKVSIRFLFFFWGGKR